MDTALNVQFLIYYCVIRYVFGLEWSPIDNFILTQTELASRSNPHPEQGNRQGLLPAMCFLGQLSDHPFTG